MAMDIADWLRQLGLERYETVFRENDVSAEVLPGLTVEDLKELGVTSVGHRRQLLNAIAKLRNNSDLNRRGSTIGPADDVPVRSRQNAGERRPVSVMFCDMMGFTQLSSRLDPEDLSEVIRGYQSCVATIIRQFGGFIARYVGDGVLIYFGWPQASETDAERAVRAALAIIAAVGQTPTLSGRVRVRIGIATGLVVVGEPIGKGEATQQTAIGETPDLAARLQAFADPDTIVISASTRRLLGDLFYYRDLGAVALKGISTPVSAWQVLRPSAVESRFEALRGPALSPLVGRDAEIELLLRRWAPAKAGDGQIVLLSGEAGVGKSRIVAALTERLHADRHLRLNYFCSPYHQDSALFPFIGQLEGAAGFTRDDTPAHRLQKLESLLARAKPQDEDTPLVADLLSLPASEEQRRSASVRSARRSGHWRR
jgi:class 3 adenylate cyclase